jgi:serine/threonine protein kinase
LSGISQNPDTNDYILVNTLNFTNWMSGNEKIDDLIQDMRLRVDSNFNIIFEWIPYNQFTYIKEIGKGGFATVYAAIWKDGPLKYDADKKIYTRVSNKKIALKCLNNLQNVTNKFLNEVQIS